MTLYGELEVKPEKILEQESLVPTTSLDNGAYRLQELDDKHFGPILAFSHPRRRFGCDKAYSASNKSNKFILRLKTCDNFKIGKIKFFT